MYARLLKRLIDVVAAFIMLVILSPLMIVIYLILLTEGENPIFSQKRIGLNERVFTLIKFKSMKTIKDADGELLPAHLRVTLLGRILRKSSLDELPQLINVLKGDMSFVGPRPLYVIYLPYYTPEELARHSVRPGITGLAQVNGRNTLSWDEKLSFDIFYVRNLSFKMDCGIFLKTIVNMLLAKGVMVNDPAIYLSEERKDWILEKTNS